MGVIKITPENYPKFAIISANRSQFELEEDFYRNFTEKKVTPSDENEE